MLQQIIETVDTVISHWDQWLGYAIAAVASLDKLVMVVIKTASNIRDAWYESFPKKDAVNNEPSGRDYFNN